MRAVGSFKYTLALPLIQLLNLLLAVGCLSKVSALAVGVTTERKQICRKQGDICVVLRRRLGQRSDMRIIAQHSGVTQELVMPFSDTDKISSVGQMCAAANHCVVVTKLEFNQPGLAGWRATNAQFPEDMPLLFEASRDKSCMLCAALGLCSVLVIWQHRTLCTCAPLCCGTLEKPRPSGVPPSNFWTWHC